MPALEIVADRLPGGAAEIRKGADYAAAIQSGSFWLHTASAVGEARRAQDGDKDLHRDDLAGAAIDELAGAAGEIDEQLLAGDMRLAHRRLQPARPSPVQVASTRNSRTRRARRPDTPPTAALMVTSGRRSSRCTQAQSGSGR